MQVVWEADTAAFASRKRAARACVKCRAAKKRCHHTFQRPPEQKADSDGLDRVLPNLTHKEPIRFVGDLNPESILTDLSSRAKGGTRISRVGTWVEQSRHPHDTFAPEDLGPPVRSCNKTPINVEKYGKFEGGRRVLTGHQRNYLQAVGAFRVLPKATQDALIPTFISCLDGILPILYGPKLLKEWTDGRCSIFLIQAICLVTCKTEEAAPFLRLYDDGPLLDPIPFARSLHTGLDAAMKADLEPDRVTKIQILTLMHLHNDGPGGLEESSLNLSQAIHDAWSIGLHILTPGRTYKDQFSMLWWTIWALDKFNACLGGRPVMIADRDIDISPPPLEATPKSQVITIWLRLGHLLDKVIEFYRPTANPDDTGWETEFPTFASLVSDIDLDAHPLGEQHILEICYLVIAILSCRVGGPTTASYARRISAADRIQQLVSGDGHKQIPPLPLVPYAAGLSLTVVYRCLRDKANIDLERAKADLATRCETLESLSTYWWTADAMARLGRKALKSLQQPGAGRHSIVSLQNDMDAEVGVCRYGPFDNKGRHQHSHHGGPHNAASTTTSTSKPTLSGNALHVLSDVAATRRTPGGPSGPNVNLNAASHSALPPTPTSSSHFVSPSMSHSHNAHHTGPQLSDTMTPRDASPHSSSHRFDTVEEQQQPASGQGQEQISVSPFDQYQYQFNDLDNLFEGFFDLSMPTIFQDPLFDGDAFINADLGLGEFDHVGADASAAAEAAIPNIGVGVDVVGSSTSTYNAAAASAGAAEMSSSATKRNMTNTISNSNSTVRNHGNGSGSILYSELKFEK
ncbi:hypothetical protein PV08_06154 [Exophiala spinifera]|uniref:Xylanolytic transcriptional activator regulatory domain-containing protein n=1 Tax=Exophiala spinifera TaxID=91928 RepID=A0A0D2BAV6_9EURO|nr:uncharacterized protein PV08_06154 [Exophiala spinifera]KIW16103.1 hypothetical protein PV08_06154 [Exophiala spinifera]